MSRRTIWIAVAVTAVASAGFLLAVVVPRDSDELPPPKVVVDTTITIPPGEPAASRHSTGHVMRAFGRSGLPLTRLRLEGWTVYNPSGGKLPDAILEPRTGRFVVYLWESEADAVALVTTAPAVDPVRGQRRTMLRDSNVVVTVQPPQKSLERRIRRVLRSL